MDEQVPPVESPASAPIESPASAQKIFELFVEQLAGETAAINEALIVRLRWFGEDIAKAADRIASDPSAALAVVQALSTIMQELDAHAGASSTSRTHVTNARRWALLLPETSIHG